MAQAPSKTRIIACGAIAREIIAICRNNGLTHVDLVCLPAIWHVYPAKIAPAMRAAIAEARSEGYQRIFIGYAECGTQGELDKICAEEGIERIGGPHCYSFFTGNDTFTAQGDANMTSFFLTDFLARQFDAFVTKPLGLDRHPELRDAYFGNYETLVYLAQTDDAALDAKARQAAKDLGLAYERRFTGYGDLATTLSRL